MRVQQHEDALVELITAHTRMYFRIAIGIAALAMALVALTPVEAQAAELWLDEDFSGGVNSTFDGGSGLIATSNGHNGPGLLSKINTGAHWGTSAYWNTKTHLGYEPDEMWMRYYIQFAPGFKVNEPYRGKLPGFSGLYTYNCLGGRPSTPGAPCWSARMSFSPLYEGDGLPTRPVDPDKVTRIGFYPYLLNNSDVGQTGKVLHWNPDIATLDHGTWYCVEAKIAMNTLGESDGVLEGYVDGQQAFAANNLRFRRASESQLKVKTLWFDVYYGGNGTSPRNNEIYFDSLAAGPTRIGCNDGDTHNGTFFDDDDSIFEADIEQLAASGITKGCNPPTNDKFCPKSNVTRGQMAAFLDRALSDQISVTLPAEPSPPPDFWGGKSSRNYKTTLDDYNDASAGWDTYILGYPIDETGTDRDWLSTGPSAPTGWVPNQLDYVWQRGATPYVNVTVNDLGRLNSGAFDRRVTSMLNTFKAYTDAGGGRRLILDILPNSNDRYENWGDNPGGFKAAYAAIATEARQILGDNVRIAFTQKSAMRSNRYSTIDHGIGGYKLWWPGADLVDLAGIYSYSDSGIRVYEDAIDELADATGAGTPLFISLAGRSSTPDEAAQMDFISDLVDLTRSHPQMMGVQWHDSLYQGRDMRTSTDSGVDIGYAAAVNGGQTGGIDWLFSPAATDWEATWRSVDPFTDTNGSVFAASIRWLAASGITRGCGNEKFCPDSKVTRGQMAAFLTRALKLPAPSQTISFDDTNGHLFEDAISRLAHAGITKGCAPTRFCPDKNVTREQMAAFLSRAGLTD